MIQLFPVLFLSVELDVAAAQCKCDLRNAPYANFLLKAAFDSAPAGLEERHTAEDTQLSPEMCGQLISALTPVKDEKIRLDLYFSAEDKTVQAQNVPYVVTDTEKRKADAWSVAAAVCAAVGLAALGVLAFISTRT